MHSFRLRYIALGLLIYIQSAFSETCGSDFVDLASRTVLSQSVFEGDALDTLRRSDGRLLVLFRVRKMLKGNLTTPTPGDDQLYVVVGHFGHSLDSDSCVAPMDDVFLDSKTSHLVFLNGTGRPVQSLAVDQLLDSDLTNFSSHIIINNGSRSISYFSISSSPEKATKAAREEVAAYCARRSVKPSIGVSPSALKQNLKIGQKFHISCKVIRGRPPPQLRWYRNGTVLTKGKQLTFRNSSRALVLQIKKIKATDAGVYHCRAVNALGQTQSHNITVELTEIRKQHSKPCSDQEYCLNDGICYLLMPMKRLFCECKTGFVGERCQEKETDLARRQDLKRRLFKRTNGSHS